jgi:hypothetical protein
MTQPFSRFINIFASAIKDFQRSILEPQLRLCGHPHLPLQNLLPTSNKFSIVAVLIELVDPSLWGRAFFRNLGGRLDCVF